MARKNRKHIDSAYDRRALHIYMLRRYCGWIFQRIADFYRLSNARVQAIYSGANTNFRRGYYEETASKNEFITGRIKSCFRVYEEKDAQPEKSHYTKYIIHVNREAGTYTQRAIYREEKTDGKK